MDEQLFKTYWSIDRTYTLEACEVTKENVVTLARVISGKVGRTRSGEPYLVVQSFSKVVGGASVTARIGDYVVSAQTGTYMIVSEEDFEMFYTPE